MAKNIGLGRGLGALMEMDSLGVSGTSSINEVELSLIYPNPHQPRSHFDEESLAELASRQTGKQADCPGCSWLAGQVRDHPPTEA